MRRFSIALFLGWLLCFPASAQRINRTQFNPGGDFDIVSYGGVCDGSTSINAALVRVRTAVNAAGGGTVWFPGGKTCVLSGLATINIPNLKWRAYGGSTVLKAANGANLARLLQSTSAATGFTMQDMVFDGNRANNGTTQSGLTPANAVLFIGGANTTLINVEIKNGQSVGLFIGDNAVAPSNFLIQDCYIHDNGGVIDATGFGVGIYIGGTAAPTGGLVQGGLIARNYNTITSPGQSNGLAGSGMNSLKVMGVHFLNNLSLIGGQLYLTSGGTCSGGPGYNNIAEGNTILQTITFGSDTTIGIEVCANRTVVANNIIDGMSYAGITLNGGTPDGTVTGNTINNSTTGILLGNSTGQEIFGNRINSTVGVNFSDAGATGQFNSNDLTGSATPVTGTLPVGMIIGSNRGYGPTYTSDPAACTPAITPDIYRSDTKVKKFCSDTNTWTAY